MLFAQTVQFFPSGNGSHTNNTTGYYPEHLGNIVFTSYFSILKTNEYDKIQVYKLITLPFFIVEEEIGKEIFGLPKIIGVSTGGYIEWRETAEQLVCDFGDHTVCRDPPMVQKRINNMCLEQLIGTNRSFHCHVKNSLYSSPHFEKIGSNVMALSTRTPINCAITAGFHVFKNLTIIHLGCNDSFYCEGNIYFIGDKRCQTLKPYILKTVNEDIVPVVESIRPLNISLPKVYPFASDKNLILTLEEQMKIQDRNIKETEKTGNSLSEQQNISATRPMVIILTVVLSILLILVVFLALCLLYRCRRNLQTHQSPIVNIGTTMNQPASSVQQPTQDNLGSLHDLLKAFALNKAVKT
ncbi:unnamed protein product [Didymodactylos carnosus]|uniref:Uncharacterized protein n=1 Tax=Didymodactylos carnosus TaxID=1234261 RepID=A0A8S2GRK5_9BILA|nr:unnamed protein product [Didymodactylos carnosus]CAF3551692.1 unnamed protein product [Didymodactylos carnosus]